MSAQQAGTASRGLPPRQESYGPYGNHLGHFQVVERVSDKGADHVVLNPEDPKFSISAAIVHLALRLLESKRGRASLMIVGETACDAWWKRGTLPKDIAELVKRDMDRLVEYHLRRMRDRFCTVVLMGVEEIFAEVIPAANPPVSSYTGPDDFDPDWYDPKDIGIMIHESSLQIMELLRYLEAINDNSEDALNRKNALVQFKELVMAMALKTAHEIAHVFIGFLSCLQGIRLNTPPEVRYSVYGPAYPVTHEDLDTRLRAYKYGEAGNALEFYGWGGLAFITTNDSDDDEDYNFCDGRLAMETIQDDIFQYRIIPVDVVDKFLDAPHDFDLQDLQGAMTQLERTEKGPAPDKDEVGDVEIGPSETGEEPALGRTEQNAQEWAMAHRLKLEEYKAGPMYFIHDTRALEEFVRNPNNLVAAELVKE